MSARDRVRRLLESATMNARAVISAIKTFFFYRQPWNVKQAREKPESCVLSQALQNRMGAVQCGKGYVGILRCGQTVCCDHLVVGVMISGWRERGKGEGEHLYVGVALHNLLYPGQRQGRVTIVGSLLLCSIDLSLPEGVEELVKGLS